MESVRKKPKQEQHRILEALDIIGAQDQSESMTQETAQAWIYISTHPFFKDLLDRLANVENSADRFNNHAHLNGELVVKL